MRLPGALLLMKAGAVLFLSFGIHIFMRESEKMQREYIRQRQKEGIAAAKAKGVVFGRRPIKKPDDFMQIKEQWETGILSARMAGERLGVSYKTFLKWADSGT